MSYDHGAPRITWNEKHLYDDFFWYSCIRLKLDSSLILRFEDEPITAENKLKIKKDGKKATDLSTRVQEKVETIYILGTISLKQPNFYGVLDMFLI